MNDIQKKFSKIYDENVDKIYRFVYIKVGSKEFAEDICSEAFSRGWNVFQKKGEQIENPRAFLYKIARNLIADHWRKYGQMRTIPVEYVQMSDPQIDLEKQVALGSDMESVRNALASINDNYQNIIVWHYLDELSIKEVSKAMKKSEQTVRVTLHRALKALKKEMDKK